MRLVILGLSITSSWGNGHATTYRGLIRELHALGHSVLFLERDVPWYAPHRDLPQCDWCDIQLYADLDDLRERFATAVRDADAVIVGSYVPDGIAVGAWAQETARGLVGFYDIDTPVTLARLAADDCDYLAPAQIPDYDIYLSFSAGPILRRLENQYGSPCARPLHCAFDPDMYHPEAAADEWDLGYLGTYSVDRQPRVEQLLLEPATRWPQGRFVVGGPMYPESVQWPANVQHRDHVPPAEHRGFYNRQRWTLNVTRDDMIAAGWSPSVRLFEAAACGTPIISDSWPGLEDFFTPGDEIVLAQNSDEVLHALRDLDQTTRQAIARRARERVLAEHTAAHRAQQLVDLLQNTIASTRSRTAATGTPSDERESPENPAILRWPERTAGPAHHDPGSVVPQPAPARRQPDRA